ncbi:MAG: PhnD/SsuA/transferrin family substrate-binding protein [Candidatus Schekmanbacteria bacterium]|nr:PhnD/SsuA/transferrin family substrate-binding protein [Candidatus Schekmanbacteria bacterium]
MTARGLAAVVPFLLLATALAVAPGRAAGEALRLAAFWPESPHEDVIDSIQELEELALAVEKTSGGAIAIVPSIFKRFSDFRGAVSESSPELALTSPFAGFWDGLGAAYTVLAVAEVAGATSGPWIIIVDASSAAANLADLHGATLATPLTADLGLQDAGRLLFLGVIDPVHHFGELALQTSAQSAVLAVKYRLSQAALVPASLPQAQRLISDGSVRVVSRTIPAPNLMLVGRVEALGADRIAALRRLLAGMSGDAATRLVLEKMGIDRWRVDGAPELITQFLHGRDLALAELAPRPPELVMPAQAATWNESSGDQAAMFPPVSSSPLEMLQP